MICLHAYKKYEYQVRGQMFLENEKKKAPLLKLRVLTVQEETW